MDDEELTADRWMRLLDEVREELGEGKIGGIAFGRRLEFSSPYGAWDLSLLADAALGHVTLFRFYGRKDFPASFHLGPRRDLEATESWVETLTGDAAFDSECTIWTATPDPVVRMLSESVRKSIAELWTFHPALSLSLYPKSVAMALPGVLGDRAGIISFLLAATGCVQELVTSAGSVA